MIVVIHGVHYHIRIDGDGEPLVLLHGFTGSSASWSDLARVWQRNYRVLRPDLIGHGQTDKPADVTCYTMERATADLRLMLDKLGIEQAVIAGYSLGGRVALQFASRYPRYIKKLILESASPGLSDPQEREDRKQHDEALAERILADGIDAFVEQWESLPLFYTQKKLPPQVRMRERSERLQNDPVGLANSLKGMGTGVQPPLWDKLNRLACPVLLVTGELDEKFNRLAREMKSRNPRFHSVVVPGAGHNVHVEQPQAFREAVERFLS